MPAASRPLLRISVSWIRLTAPFVADGDQPERAPPACRHPAALAGQAVDHRPARLAAAGERDRLVAAMPLPRVPRALGIHLDQPEQQLQRPVPLLRPEAVEQIVGAAG